MIDKNLTFLLLSAVEIFSVVIIEYHNGLWNYSIRIDISL